MWGPRRGRSLVAGILEEVAGVLPAQQGNQHLHVCMKQVQRAAWYLGGIEG